MWDAGGCGEERETSKNKGKNGFQPLRIMAWHKPNQWQLIDLELEGVQEKERAERKKGTPYRTAQKRKASGK